MKELYNAIVKTLTDQVPAIRWTDFDLGQYEAQPLPAVSWPAALVGFNKVRATCTKALTA